MDSIRPEPTTPERGATVVHDAGTQAVPTSATSRSNLHKSGMAALTLAALGVVYGDIGTSPLYTFKEVFGPLTGIPLTTANIVGAVSVIFWALLLVVTLKYVLLILRADHNGEGGILALASLASRTAAGRPKLRGMLLLIGVAGATLFYGDGVITPAISVVGAMEGLEVVAPAASPFIVEISLAILIGLFMIQRHGTGKVGRAFGPIILLWFATLAVAGIAHIVQQPQILAALNPLHAWQFLTSRGWHLFVVMGAIVLALTGAEALYADLGHFGRKPIQLAWASVVLPGLALNYMGQGALLLGNPEAVDNPFFRMFPTLLAYPVLLLATLAAIIASQAVITGAYSMTKQAIQLGFFPRMAVRYTSVREAGQIYMPGVNFTLMVGVIVVVTGFGSSSALAGAYGIAVTLTMMITSFLAFFVMSKRWKLGAIPSAAITTFFLALDVLMVGGCILKLPDGGWLPLVLGGALFVLMSTWHRGRELILANAPDQDRSLKAFILELAAKDYPRVDGTAIYLVATPNRVPQALASNLRHNKVLHERNIVLHLQFVEEPWIGMSQRTTLEPLGNNFWRITLKFGFMNVPDVPKALQLCNKQQGLRLDEKLEDTTFFLSQLHAVPTPGQGMALWRERLFVAMSARAGNAAAYFCLPDNAVVRLGTRVPI
ncbi:potassium transporter Kup [Solimonas marina]|uniref:Probable potassium transport system protein Kup n=1 Tax=Solimonas marina TaxID=2714601 RepID=A0A970B3B9_9GAMM|nr:potassium transporter Kup [Solimonas marina]NKF21082.1 potassium transporter Kup [Solimonas marina]